MVMKKIGNSQPRIAVTSRTFSRHAVLKAELKALFPNSKFNDEGIALSGSALIEFLKGNDGAIVALEPVNSSVLNALPELQIISKYGVGLDNLDLEDLNARGVKLGWTSGVNARSVSELALGFALGSARNILNSTIQMRKSVWQNAGGVQLSQKTVGIIGFGNIGRDLCSLLAPFRCNILVNDIVDYSQECSKFGYRFVEKREIFEKSDIISLHVPLTDQTKYMIGVNELASMKSTAILINTSRGQIVDETALRNALLNKQLAAAAMDVFASEPFTDPGLLGLENFFGTPHIGGSSAEAVLAMGRSAIQHLSEFFDLGV